MDTRLVGAAAAQLGAGRERKGDAVDYGAGIELHKNAGRLCAERRQYSHAAYQPERASLSGCGYVFAALFPLAPSLRKRNR